MARSTSAASSAGVASARAMRVGARLAPLQNMRSPFTDRIHLRIDTWRRPVRKRRRSDTRLPAASRTRTSTDACSRCASPRAWGHHRRGRSTVTVHSTVLGPAASVRSVPWSTAPTVVRRCTSVAATASRSAVSASTARSGPASTQRVTRWRMRTGPDSSRCTGRQMPPGFQSGSMASQCWKTPVMFRLWVRFGLRTRTRPRRRAGARSATAELVADLELVGEEVPLRGAEVGPVEPHVALVEEAVEAEPPPAVVGARGLLEAHPVEQRAVVVGEGRSRAPVAGHRDRLPARVVQVRRRRRCGADLRRPAQPASGRGGP